MATTTNYSWTTPDDTDLVKDGAAAIRTLGSSIDTTVFNNANAAIAKTIVDAKGDLIAATAADTVARLAVGANDTVLTADSSTATGLKWATVSAGGMTQLATGSLSGSAVNITSISGTYKNLQLVVRNFLPSNDNANFRIRFNNDSNVNRYRDNLPNTSVSELFDQNLINIGVGNDNSVANGIVVLDVFDYANTSTYKFLNMKAFLTNSSDTTAFNYSYDRFGAYNQTGAITEINLIISAGTFTSGTYILYGVS